MRQSSLFPKNIKFKSYYLFHRVKKFDQEDPCTAVICDNGNQIIDRRDKRSGCNGRVHLDLMEEHRDQRTYQT